MAGYILNEQVWKLFEKAGFNTIPNSINIKTEHIIKLAGKPRTPDLLAVESKLKVRIIGENKSGKSIGSSTSSVINDLASLVGADKADAGILIITEKEVTDDEVAFARSKKIFIWTDEQFRYYQTLVDTLGSYSKYEIIRSLNIRTYDQSLVHSTIALKIQQPYSGSDISLYIFSISPEVLLKTCVILRRAQGNKDAYQRILNKKRLANIQKFVSTSNAVLPTNIIVHFSDEIVANEIKLSEKNTLNQKIQYPQSKIKVVNLQIPMKYGSLEILDGQHRLYGFLHADAATKDIFNLVVCGIEGMDSNFRRDTFVAINDNAKKIDPNLVTFLKFVEDETECQNSEELMAIKIVFYLNKKSDSPFYKKIKILDVHKEQIITLKGFAGYDLKSLLGKRGVLRKFYSNNSREYFNVLSEYFSEIKRQFKYQYSNPNKYIFFTNRGISAFLKLLKSILKTEKGAVDKRVFSEYIKYIANNSTQTEWEIEKLKSKYVGSGGWKQLHRDLTKKIKREKPNFKE